MWFVFGAELGQIRPNLWRRHGADVNVARILDPELEVMFVTDQCAGAQSFRSLAEGAESR